MHAILAADLAFFDHADFALVVDALAWQALQVNSHVVYLLSLLCHLNFILTDNESAGGWLDADVGGGVLGLDFVALDE